MHVLDDSTNIAANLHGLWLNFHLASREDNHYAFWEIFVLKRSSDRTDLSTESGSRSIQLARAWGRTECRSVAESLPYCMT